MKLLLALIKLPVHSLGCHPVGGKISAVNILSYFDCVDLKIFNEIFENMPSLHLLQLSFAWIIATSGNKFNVSD
uniref:Putative secreted protein n=1 Tax=Amblyomma triste TaxID=251400 RepID=A0A023G395_AMBTT